MNAFLPPSTEEPMLSSGDSKVGKDQIMISSPLFLFYLREEFFCKKSLAGSFSEKVFSFEPLPPLAPLVSAMNLAIVKYNAGNVQSVRYALERLGVTPLLTDDPEALASADKVIFPGVGEASTAMRYLREKGLDRVLVQLTQPFLGICLGMQLMGKHSEENDVECLGVYDHAIKRFPASAGKVPHMGWNRLDGLRGPLLQSLPPEPYVYFVHSYYVELGPATVATCEYGLPFSAVMQQGQFYATQFHPEKSGEVGAKILENFLAL